jgi:hypothetical protein
MAREFGMLWRARVPALALSACAWLGACGGGASGTAGTPPPAPTALAIAYSSTTYQYTVGIAAQTLTPNNSSSIRNWSISPALPAGLTLSGTTGAISGTPTADSPTTTYVIKGVTSSGQPASGDLIIGVTSNVVLNLGDVDAIQFIQFDSAHLLTEDANANWILWNSATTQQIASGIATIIVERPEFPPLTEPAPMALAGSAMVIQKQSGLELRSAATGAVAAEVAMHLQWWKLASDGSYVCAGSDSALTCWSPSGQQLFSESGNYYSAIVFAAPGQLLVAFGAAGPQVIETVSTAAWTSSVGAGFQGKFSSWFVDGSQFLTTIPAGTQVGTTLTAFDTLFVYSLASVLEDTETMPTLQGLTGQGHWFWTASSTAPLTIYAVGNNTASCMPIPCTMPTPAATYTLYAPLTAIDSFIASIAGNALTIIDLSGAAPLEMSFTLPVTGPSAFAAIAPSQFVVGTGEGVIVDGSTPNSPRYFGYGAVTNLVGGNTRAVFTTASGSTFSYNTTTHAFEPTLNLAADVQLAVSANGGVLAGLDGSGNVDIYSMPAGPLVQSFPASANGGGPASISLSAPGTTLGEMFNNGTDATVPVAGGTPTVYPNAGTMLLFSPDGTLIAVSNTGWPPGYGSDYVAPPPTTSIYQNGTLLTTVPGWAWQWLSNSSFLVANYSCCTGGPGGGAAIFTGYKAYTATGTAVATPATGPTTWASADPSSNSAVAGTLAVLVSANLVIAQPF